MGVKSVNIKFIGREFQFDPSSIPLSNEITKIEKKRPMGATSVNMKILGHEIQFDPDFIPISCEITKIGKKKPTQLGVKSVNI